MNAAGSSATEVVRVSLREEADKAKVAGHHSQIRGGLFKVTDADVCSDVYVC